MAIAGAVIAAGTATYSIVSAENQKKKARQQERDAQNAINDFNQQDLINPYEGLRVSTIGAENQTNAFLSQNATSVDALQRGGARTVMGVIPSLTQQNILLQNQISADLDRQQTQNQQLYAQGQDKVQSLRENREMSALLGYGQQLQTARQDQVSANTNMTSGLLAAGSVLGKTDWGAVKGEWNSIFGSGGDDYGVSGVTINGKKAPLWE